jgi:hypothetical protein
VASQRERDNNNRRGNEDGESHRNAADRSAQPTTGSPPAGTSASPALVELILKRSPELGEDRQVVKAISVGGAHR